MLGVRREDERVLLRPDATVLDRRGGVSWCTTSVGFRPCFDDLLARLAWGLNGMRVGASKPVSRYWRPRTFNDAGNLPPTTSWRRAVNVRGC